MQENLENVSITYVLSQKDTLQLLLKKKEPFCEKIFVDSEFVKTCHKQLTNQQ